MTANDPHGAPLVTRVLQGAALVLFMTAFWLFFGGNGRDLSAAQLTLLTVGAAGGGGFGGAAYFGLDAFRNRGGWHKTIANILSLVAYAAATVAILALGVLLFFRDV